MTAPLTDEQIRATLDDAFRLVKTFIAMLPPNAVRPTDAELRARLWREWVKAHPELVRPA